MSDDTFVYFGRLRDPELTSRLLNLLPPDRRDRRQVLLQQTSDLPEAELRSRLKRLRESEWRRRWSVADRRAGGRLRALPLRVQSWIWRRAEESHGREDHQS